MAWYRIPKGKRGALKREARKKTKKVVLLIERTKGWDPRKKVNNQKKIRDQNPKKRKKVFVEDGARKGSTPASSRVPN